MDNFIVSARKYRPDTFDSVVGQKNITATLKNAISGGKLAHAYLFCGPRGVGKTTSARIFAKTINCTNISDNYEACNQCESCESFNENRSYNIHELDAASNNSVDDIRNLIDQVRIPPQLGQYSVYIIDEVHMLSQQAFNAFLKTLEEPPKHARFILATTEKHKILPTILSRCQIFDFSRITVEDAAAHLAYVAGQEGITAEQDALHVIAQKADGAMRDALSYFDQIVSFSGKKITYQKVIDNLNVLDYDFYFKLTDAFLANNYQEALLIFDKILDKGFDGHHFITGLSAHFRDLLVCTDKATVELLEVGAGIKENYLKQATDCQPDYLMNALAIGNKCDYEYKLSTNKRLHVELCILQLANLIKKKDETEVEASETTENKGASTPEVAKTTPKNTPPPAPSGPASFSIKEQLQVQKQAQPELQKEEKPVEETYKGANLEFTVEAIKAAWAEYTQTLEHGRLRSALAAQTPKLISETQMEFFVSNEKQKEKIDEMLPLMNRFLRNTLKNSEATITIVVNEVKQEKKVYTKKEKYEYLTEKNEVLSKLTQQFGLDLD